MEESKLLINNEDMFQFIMKMYAKILPIISQAMQVRAGEHAKLLKTDEIYFRVMGGWHDQFIHLAGPFLRHCVIV